MFLGDLVVGMLEVPQDVFLRGAQPSDTDDCVVWAYAYGGNICCR